MQKVKGVEGEIAGKGLNLVAYDVGYEGKHTMY